MSSAAGDPPLKLHWREPHTSQLEHFRLDPQPVVKELPASSVGTKARTYGVGAITLGLDLAAESLGSSSVAVRWRCGAGARR